nr:hypothetical protein [Methanobrevibacter arboriphilus]
MVYDIYIENKLIDDNLGLSVGNKVNYKYKIANDGSAILNNYDGDVAREFQFNIYSDMGKEYNIKNSLIEKLLTLNKTKQLSFVCIDSINNTNNISCKVNILEVDKEFDSEKDTVEFSFQLIEVKPEDNTVVKFNTFNYKPSNVKSKSSKKIETPSYIKKLVNCNITMGCNIKNSTCVKYLQTLLKIDGFYTNYKKDGNPCTYTQREFEKWQKKKAKVKATGKFDTATKNYLRVRFGLTITKKSGLTVISGGGTKLN